MTFVFPGVATKAEEIAQGWLRFLATSPYVPGGTSEKRNAPFDTVVVVAITASEVTDTTETCAIATGFPSAPTTVPPIRAVPAADAEDVSSTKAMPSTTIACGMSQITLPGSIE